MSEPRCPYFGRCGGCSAQHVDYVVQVENKRKVLADVLGFSPKDVQVFFDEPFGYRNHMNMIFHRNGIGFRLKGNWKKSVDVKECLISENRLNELIKEVRDFFSGEIDSFNVVKKCGTFRHVDIKTPGEDSSILFTLNGNSTRLEAAISSIEAFARGTSARNVLVGYAVDDFFVVKGGENLKANLLGHEFEFSVQGFWQNNTVMVEKLHKYVRELFMAYEDKSEWAVLLDLYGGVGTFGINNADLFRKVKIVESFAPAIELAQSNLVRNGIENAEAIVLDAKRLKNLEIGAKGNDLYVIIDPPRSGMDPKTILRLRELEPRVIVYISCNASQLKSDLPKFIRCGYGVRSAAMFDLFPQTPHMESVVELVMTW